MNSTTSQAFRMMDEAESKILTGSVTDGLTGLAMGLQRCRADANPDEWLEFATNQFSCHSLTPILHEDPFTRHSFVKPRGYSGDADLIDYMYGMRKPEPETTVRGRAIFDYTTNTSAPQSVRKRRELLAALLDQMAGNIGDLKILSVACGHLREALLSDAVKEGAVAEYYALDQDPLSLELVKRELSDFNVRTIHAPIKSLIGGGISFNDLDFVYAAGLYDYLPQPFAIKLTSILFEMIKPGGKVLVANFAPCLRDIGYLETFMRWKLVYRNETEVNDFASGIPGERIASKRTFSDELGNVIYLEIDKC